MPKTKKIPSKKKSASRLKSRNKEGWLCSGYRVFPDGSKCKGCIDCNFGKDKTSVKKVFERSHAIINITKK
jgi:hypothetical protein